MNDTRFAPEAFPSAPQHIPAGFLLLSMGSVGSGPPSALQQIYQQLYQQAIEASRPRLPDLFTNMN
jgi:hypothetical protein